MNAKYLPFKFVLVGLLILICILALTQKGLKPGIDIAGGHSLRFALDIKTTFAGDENVRAIEVLKERLDPQGLRNLEFIPIGNTEIEIRMPAAPPQTRQARRAYTEAMNELMRANLDSGDILRLSKLQDLQRLQRAAALAAGSEPIQQMLVAAARQDKMQTILAATAAQDSLGEFQELLDQTEADLARAQEALEDDPDSQGLQSAVATARENLAKARKSVDQSKQQIKAARTLAAQLTGSQNVSDQQLRRLLGAARVMNDLLQAAKAMDAVREKQDALAEAREKLDAANDALAAEPDSQEKLQARDAAEKVVEQAKAELTAARVDLKRAQQAVRRSNIPEKGLETALRFYVSPQEAEALLETDNVKGQAEIERRMQEYRQRLEEIKDANPSKAEQIDRVAEAFEAWARQRNQLDDPADLVRLVLDAGVLEFRIAPMRPELINQDRRLIQQTELESYIRTLKDQGPDAVEENAPFRWFLVKGDPSEFGRLIVADDALGNSYILLTNSDANTMLRNTGQGQAQWELAGAGIGADDLGRPAVQFSFDNRGARLFAQLTSQNQGRALAILLDDRVYSAPNIKNAITGGSGIIEGSFSKQEVAELVRTLDAGTLPAKLIGPTSEDSFDSALGEAGKNRGIIAAVSGLAAVAIFMLAYYLLAGFIADLALVLNILLVLGAMSLMDARFTLPGIAGVILTIGIAVDANVLIFERLREEQAKGQSVGMALKNAYERAFSAIFDANLTTLATCVILGWVGTEEVRGFAITLGLGVVFSMFTALVVTRWIFQALLDTGLLKNRVPMLQVIRVPNINWMGKRKLFWGVSAVMIALGIAAMVSQGREIFGIEFVGGTKTVVQFKQDGLVEGQLPRTPLVHQKILAAAEEAGAEKLAATLTVESQQNPQLAEQYLAAADTDGNDVITQAEWQAAGLSDEAFDVLIGQGQVDADGNKQLSRAELEDMPSNLFQITTTVTDGQLIREILGEAFGPALVTRTPLEYELLAGRRSERLGVTLAPDGTTIIDEQARENVLNLYAEPFSEFEGGLLMVVRLADDQAVSTEEIAERINLVREGYRRTEVIGLDTQVDGTAGDVRFSEFAILVAPGSDITPERFDDFAETEANLLAAAMRRTESSQTQNVGAQLAGQQAGYAIMAVLLSWVAIILYLWFRFGSVQWGLAALICLVHDVVIVIGLIALSGWLYDTVLGSILLIDSFKIDLAMIAAILTVIGYSVNDTIVVFDRIRENRGKLAAVSGKVINESVNQTLPRTLLTSFTTFIVVFIMYVWGGPAIHSYNFVLLAGVIFGTYSSVAIASPLIMGFKKAVVAKVAPSDAGQPAE
ncbi:MAG: protein translocase subunit SecD [Phycisphaerae bacterium]